MPIYEYQCRQCGDRTEVLQKLTDPPVEKCPSCGGEMKKLMSAPAIQFKGTGWYITDYARKNTPAPSTSEKSSGGNGGGSSSGEGSSKGEGSSEKDKKGTSSPKSSTGDSKATSSPKSAASSSPSSKS